MRNSTNDVTSTGEVSPLRLHPQLLALFGMPIGEMFALDDLADACSDDGRYDACFTSAPLNVHGGLGSPPNALAIK